MAFSNEELEDLKPKEGWSGQEYFERMPKVHALVKEIISSYLDMSDSELQTVALWCEAANFCKHFGSFPELYINGGKQTGKTRLLNLLQALIPNSIKAVGMSESAMFRKADEVDAMLLDEAEDLASKEKKTIKDLLNVCYKSGAQVYRTEGKSTKYVVGYPVYCAVALANISGLDSVLEDKCITIIMQRSRNTNKTQIPELFDMDPRILAVRAYFGSQIKAVTGEHYEGFRCVGGQALMAKNGLLLYIYNNYSYYSLLITDSIGKNAVEQFTNFVKSSDIHGRDFELWLPLFTQAFLTKTMEETKAISNAKTKTKDEDISQTDTDSNFGLFLWELLTQHGDPTILTKDIKVQYEQQEGKTLWLDSAWIGYFMKRTGLAKKKHTNVGNRYTVNMDKLKDWLSVRNLFSEQKSLADTQKNVKEAQTSSLPPEQQLSWEAIQKHLGNGGLLLGSDFQFAPEQFREPLRGQSRFGVIYQPREGLWQKTKHAIDEGL